MNVSFPRLILALLLVSPLTSAVEARNPQVPDWIEAAMSLKTEHVDEETSAVLLHNTVEAIVFPNGRIESKVRQVISIIKGEGRGNASAIANYLKNNGKVLDAKAWLILPSGEVKEYNKKSWSDSELKDVGSLFTESRGLHLNLSASASPGSVFAYEFSTREEIFIPQGRWFLNRAIPVVQSELRITLPSHWNLTFMAANDAHFSYKREGNTFIWSSGDHAAVKSQHWAPRLARFRPFIAYTLSASEKDAPKTRYKNFDSWQRIATYMAEIGDPKARYNDAIKAKALELTAGCTSDWEKIRALTRYTQTLNYVSVSVDLSTGGGYTPNDASLVFERHYGDCKDMTVLLRALLESVGIDTYSVTALLDENSFVLPEWPSPIQFNHAIVAVQIADDVQANAVVNHPELGRLLIIDPTDSYTPPGRVSRLLQGSYCLIDSPKVTSVTLIPEDNEDQRNLVVEAILDGYGNIKAAVIEEVHGGDVLRERALHKRSSTSEYAQILDSWISSFVREASIEKWNVSDDLDSNVFRTELELISRGYGRLMGRNLLVFKPLIVSRTPWTPTSISERRRKLPVEFRPGITTTVITVTLPEGYVADEMPPEVVTIEEDFASYSLECVAEGNSLRVKRTLTWKQYELPVEEFSRLRTFTDATSRAEQTPVVLKRSQEGLAVH